MFPAASYTKFNPLAFDPISDDGVIIWTPNLIFCYYYKSGNLVPLQCSNISNDELEHPPDDAFDFTQCLASLVYASPNYYKRYR
ncbi:hypothetical protein V6N13_095587 [Hibiscus sabdariffa]|uniref:Uncharacterized protein n=1 Tax=Hibiscus sabdariffa TaxID=183260 RepID=A0ABR2B7D0_9ROSI